jgi:hypothetical protein
MQRWTNALTHLYGGRHTGRLRFVRLGRTRLDLKHAAVVFAARAAGLAQRVGSGVGRVEGDEGDAAEPPAVREQQHVDGAGLAARSKEVANVVLRPLVRQTAHIDALGVDRRRGDGAGRAGSLFCLQRLRYALRGGRLPRGCASGRLGLRCTHVHLYARCRTICSAIPRCPLNALQRLKLSVARPSDASSLDLAQRRRYVRCDLPYTVSARRDREAPHARGGAHCNRACGAKLRHELALRAPARWGA